MSHYALLPPAFHVLLVLLPGFNSDYILLPVIFFIYKQLYCGVNVPALLERWSGRWSRRAEEEHH